MSWNNTKLKAIRPGVDLKCVVKKEWANSANKYILEQLNNFKLPLKMLEIALQSPYKLKTFWGSMPPHSPMGYRLWRMFIRTPLFLFSSSEINKYNHWVNHSVHAKSSLFRYTWYTCCQWIESEENINKWRIDFPDKFLVFFLVSKVLLYIYWGLTRIFCPFPFHFPLNLLNSASRFALKLSSLGANTCSL